MSLPLSATLRFERIEDRLCPAGGINPSTPFLTVLQSTGGSAEAAVLTQQFQAGMNTATSLIQQLAGNNDFQHVVVDYQLILSIVNTGSLSGVEVQIGNTTAAYINNPSAANAASLNLMIGDGAFAAGFLFALGQDYTNHGLASVNVLSTLGTGAVTAVANNIQSVNAAAQFIIDNIHNSIGQAAQNFLTPIIPGTIDPTAFGSPPTQGAFDPDNDGDDDTGMAGY